MPLFRGAAVPLGSRNLVFAGLLAALAELVVDDAEIELRFGQALFGGQAPGLAYQDNGTAIDYIGTATAETVGIGDGQTVTRSLTGPEVLSFDYAGAPTDLFVVLGTLSAALQDPLADPSTAGRQAMSQLDAGLDQITTAQTIG